ncbi:MAG TPA: hypothetical protein EYP35_07170 [Desulfobacterales bacterium]|nr:hypothetical protein [Desulfobacterales bacterium]HIP39881.1 hypothetical protein [Desulfocapsa sulfexigens]
MTLKKNVFIKNFLLRGLYDRRINQGMWLSLATAILILCFYLTGLGQLAVFSVLAILPSLIAGVDQPAPHFSFRLARIDLLFFGSSLLVLSLLQFTAPLAVIFFPLIICLAMFAAYGNQSGRVGTAAMIVATLSLSWPDSQPFWLFPVLIGFGTLWYGAFAKFWMLWWGHRILRDNLAQLYTEIASYYMAKSLVLRQKPSKEQLAAVYARQEKVYSLINESKAYLNRFGEKGYDSELTNLEKDFLFGVDLMELLQANQHRVDEIRQFFQSNDLVPLYYDCSLSLVAVLKKKSFAVRTRRKIDMCLDIQLATFEEALDDSRDSSPLLARSLIIHFNLLNRLLSRQKPAFQRSLEIPEPMPGILATLRPHMNPQSPVVRYALRLSVTVSCGILLAGLLNLEKSYWVILAILLVMQSGYLLTKTLITQRVVGTFAGVLLGLGIIYLPMGKVQLAVTVVALALFSFSMLFYHKTWSIFGVTALVVVAYQFVFGMGEYVVFTRAEDTFLGCSLAFASNIFLWPQWNGGGIKRLLRETLEAQEDILSICVRALSDKSIRFEQLTRRRLKLYTAQNNLLASYQQMLREPHHTQQYVDSLESVISHFVAASAHINALLPMSREMKPMPEDLTRHMQLLITAMFSRCDEEEEQKVVDINLRHEMRSVYVRVERMKKENTDPQHYAVIHLLELIYERLNAIFDILDFCKTYSQ